jgi:hypothetical protein
MERPALRRTLWYLMQATAAMSVPVEAKTGMNTVAGKPPVDQVPYRLIDFLTVELILLGGLVLLAFVIVARNSKAQ